MISELAEMITDCFIFFMILLLPFGIIILIILLAIKKRWKK